MEVLRNGIEVKIRLQISFVDSFWEQITIKYSVIMQGK